MADTNPKGGRESVSVVLPCFQARATIRRAIDSVVRQTTRPIELIAVDDASTDGTIEDLRALKASGDYDWLKLIHFPANRGSSAARNAGWEAARGDYVAFLDADDTWAPRKIERQCAFMRANPGFAITGHLAHYGEPDSMPQKATGPIPTYREISRAWILLKNPMVTPSIMVRRDIGLRFHEGSRYMEDHRFLQEALFAGLRVARLNEPLAIIHKAPFGAGGLSARLWAMERGELANYYALRRASHIGALTHALLAAYSLAKFGRRLLIRLLRCP